MRECESCRERVPAPLTALLPVPVPARAVRCASASQALPPYSAPLLLCLRKRERETAAAATRRRPCSVRLLLKAPAAAVRQTDCAIAATRRNRAQEMPLNVLSRTLFFSPLCSHCHSLR